jgi:hypothetical protein
VRRFAFVVALLVLAVAGPARASEHDMRVNEVATSLGGNPAAQFVELLDPLNEPFPNPPYKLAIYDAAGNPGTVVGLGDNASIVDSGTPMLIASAAAGFGNADKTATLNLPASGQACFESSSLVTFRIHCMSWGTITNPVSPGYGGPTTTGAAPPDGQSLQRCPAGAVVASPTPKAANSCPDTTKPRATLTTAAQKLGRVISSGYKLKVKSNEKGKARAQLVRQGKVLRTSTKSLSAGVAKAFTLALPRATKLALAGARSATFTVKLRVTDAAGNVRNVTRTVTLRR